jgi:hypothetical protein
VPHPAVPAGLRLPDGPRRLSVATPPSKLQSGRYRFEFTIYETIQKGLVDGISELDDNVIH